ALVAGEFLEGFAVSGASAFEDWMTAERALWRGRSVDALLRRADELLGTGDLPGAHEMAQRALVLDPTSDVAVRAVMRCRALAGDRAGALECYETFAARLAGEVDTEPGTDTKALAERGRRGAACWRLPASPARARLFSRSCAIRAPQPPDSAGRWSKGCERCARSNRRSSSWTMLSGSTASPCSHSSQGSATSPACRWGPCSASPPT